MGSGWIKFAILGSTYARALENRAVRTHGAANVNPSTFAATAAAPHARFDTDLSSYARQSGALAPTPQSRAMTQLAHDLPWQGPEHAAPKGAMRDANAMLYSRGLAQRTPAGQVSTHTAIKREFGDGSRPPQGTEGPPAAATPRPAGPDPMQHLDSWQHLNPTKPRDWMPPTARTIPTDRPSNTQILRNIQAQTPRAPTPQGGSTAVLGRPPATQVLKTAGPLPYIAGIGIPLAVGGSMLAGKPGIQSNVKNLFSGKGSTEEQDKSNELPTGALQQADSIHQTLLAHGLDPTTMRIGIDAPPGSGKTTLARALAQRTGMKHYGLDWEPGNAWKSTIGLGRNVESMPHAPRAGEIMEHYLLNRTHDPELFDAQVHLRRDPNVIRQQLNHRGNSAYIGDTMDLDKSLAVADLGFDTLGGDTIDLGNGTVMKLRPHEGWGNNLDQQLTAKGIDPSGLSRHSKLLSLHGGKRTEGAGWTPYVKNPLSHNQTMALGASIPLGMLAARMLSKHGNMHPIDKTASDHGRNTALATGLGGIGLQQLLGALTNTLSTKDRSSANLHASINALGERIVPGDIPIGVHIDKDANPGAGKRLISIKPNQSDAAIAHELGHVQTYEHPLTKWMRPAAALNKFTRYTGLASGLYGALADDPSYAPALAHLALSTPTLLSEAAASMHALRGLTAESGLKGLGQAATLLPAFGTYAVPALTPLAMAAAKRHKRGSAMDFVHDLSPLARRALTGAAIGATGGALADSDHRGRGALLGAAGGAGLGAGYNALRPIHPAAMPGTYKARVRPSSATKDWDYHTPTSSDESTQGWHRANKLRAEHVTETHRKPVDDYTEFDRVPHAHDNAGRPITVSPVIDTTQNLDHLRADHTSTMNDSSLRQEFGDLLHQSYDAEAGGFGDISGRFPRRNVRFEYEGPLGHDSKQTPEINEMRRRLRKAGK